MSDSIPDHVQTGLFEFETDEGIQQHKIPLISEGFGSFYWRQAKTNIPVFFKSDYNPWLSHNFDVELNKLARNLTVDGIVIIKNYISLETIEYMQKTATSSSKLGPKFLFCEDEDDPAMITAKSLAESMRFTLWRILVQPSSPFYLKFYLKEKGIPETDAGLSDHFNGKGHWWRFMRYVNNDSMEAHIDAPGEIMSILYLSKRGYDYEDGCLFVSSPEDFSATCNICDLASPGDLILIDGHRLPHGVSKIKAQKSQLGRLTLFVPGYPF